MVLQRVLVAHVLCANGAAAFSQMYREMANARFATFKLCFASAANEFIVFLDHYKNIWLLIGL